MSTKPGTETPKVETMIRFAQALDAHDDSSEEERLRAFEDAQAEGVSNFDSLRTRILLKMTNGNASLVGAWLSEFEFGDFSDNYEALAVSLRRVEHGEVERGLVGLCLLREHILRSTEVKSSRHILPVIDKALTGVTVQALGAAGRDGQHPEDEALEEFDAFPLFT
jgi:hypothetical protein